MSRQKTLARRRRLKAIEKEKLQVFREEQENGPETLNRSEFIPNGTGDA
jgi:hypothetical protein